MYLVFTTNWTWKYFLRAFWSSSKCTLTTCSCITLLVQWVDYACMQMLCDKAIINISNMHGNDACVTKSILFYVLKLLSFCRLNSWLIWSYDTGLILIIAYGVKVYYVVRIGLLVGADTPAMFLSNLPKVDLSLRLYRYTLCLSTSVDAVDGVIAYYIDHDLLACIVNLVFCCIPGGSWRIIG